MIKEAFAIMMLGCVLVASQNCDEESVGLFPHYFKCQKYFLCADGVSHELSCAPGLHFSPTQKQCMLPKEAECLSSEQESNEKFLSDKTDCQKYFVLHKGSQVAQKCSDDLWWDTINNWCTFKDDVTCDSRTLNNPRKLLKPNLSQCHKKDDLKTDEGVYLKSYCLIAKGETYANAENTCRKLNMELFVISSSTVQLKFLNSITVTSPNGHYWINGKKHGNPKQWFTYSSKEAPLFEGVDWVEDECLFYTNPHKVWKAKAMPCSSGSRFICEYYV